MNYDYEQHEREQWAAAMETEPNDDHNPEPNARPWWMGPVPNSDTKIIQTKTKQDGTETTTYL